MEVSDSSFWIKIFSKNSNNFCKILDLYNIIVQGDTRIKISTKKIKFFTEGNVRVNLYPLLSSASDVNRPFLSLFVFMNVIDLKLASLLLFAVGISITLIYPLIFTKLKP